MNKKFKDEAELFGAILDNPKLLTELPATERHDKNSLEIFYLILGDDIAPYIPYEIFLQLKKQGKKYKVEKTSHPIILESEEEILHNVLNDIEFLNQIPTNEKYDNDFLEFIYIIWGDKIEPYIPKEMFEWLKNESLMKQYHENHKQNQENWVNEVNKKIKMLSK